jgi:oligosaccharide 4-alpha-D-glucosyltransferase
MNFPYANGTMRIREIFDDVIKCTFVPPEWDNCKIVHSVILPELESTLDNVIVIEREIWFGKGRFGHLLNITKGDVNGHDAYGFVFQRYRGEKFYGGGQVLVPQDGLCHQRVLFYNRAVYGYDEKNKGSLNYMTPFFISSRGFGLFFENTSLGVADFGNAFSNANTFMFTSGELSFYIISGGSPAKVLSNYHRMVGSQSLPPKWLLGTCMSRFGYRSQTELIQVYRNMKEKEMTPDIVFVDLYWFKFMGDFQWNLDSWPNIRQMIDELHSNDTKIILITEPYISKSSINYNETQHLFAQNAQNIPTFIGTCGLLDIFRDETKQWVWNQYSSLFHQGIDGVWFDLGEPEQHPPYVIHNVHGNDKSNYVVHNAYNHEWSKTLFERCKLEFPDIRLVNFSRSGASGSCRYGVVTWTGDVARDWLGYRSQGTILPNMSISGIPFAHSDAGGFAGGIVDPELYNRWLQFAAFTPIFRPHGSCTYIEGEISIPSEPCFIHPHYGEAVKETINLRKSLMTYNYCLVYEHILYGKPLMSPMWFYFGTNSQTEFMWGEYLLVAPIWEPFAAQRSVQLPKGTEWLDISGLSIRSKHQGNTVIKAELNHLVLFLKEGGFLFLHDDRKLKILHFPMSISVMTLYFDVENGFDTGYILTKKSNSGLTVDLNLPSFFDEIQIILWCDEIINDNNHIWSKSTSNCKTRFEVFF